MAESSQETMDNPLGYLARNLHLLTEEERKELKGLLTATKPSNREIIDALPLKKRLVMWFLIKKKLAEEGIKDRRFTVAELNLPDGFWDADKDVDLKLIPGAVEWFKENHPSSYRSYGVD